MRRFRSKLEQKVSEKMHNEKIKHQYESSSFTYVVPATGHTYTPDFTLSNEVYLECKGAHRWGGLDKSTRNKMIYMKEQWPGSDIRFIFDKVGNKLSKAKKSKTWEKWCDQNGFEYAYVDDFTVKWKDLK